MSLSNSTSQHLMASKPSQQPKSGTSSKNTKGAGTNETSRKRVPERGADGRASAKRAASATQNGSRQDVLKSQIPENLQSFIVEKLHALLKERSLSVKGKKDELIARLRSTTGSTSSTTVTPII